MSTADDALTTTLATQIAGILGTTTNPAIERARALIAERLAALGGVVPSRIPSPLNITEIGGYLNLLESAGEIGMRTNAIASALGIAGPLPMDLASAGPALFFATRSNVHDDATLDAPAPLTYTVRSDFAPAFDTAMQSFEQAGCDLQWLDCCPISLPPYATGGAPPADLISFTGRVMQLVPGCALRNASTDRYVLGGLAAGDPPHPFARVTDAGAVGAAAVPVTALQAWQCTGASCLQVAANAQFVAVPAILGTAGWLPESTITLPSTRPSVGNGFRFINIGGLVAGVTTLKDELSKLFSPAEMNSSSLRDALARVWNGSDFA